MKPHSKDNDITLSPQAEHRPCVLIVDGDKVSQRAIELALTSSKYAIEWVRNGEAAFDILAVSPDGVAMPRQAHR